MKLSTARAGTPLRIAGRDVDFGFWAMKRGTRRWGVHSSIYATNPWAVAEGAVRAEVAGQRPRAAALSFVSQAHEYFRAADQASTIETRPLLYYYSFLNLGKALAIVRGRPNMVGRVEHGIAPVGSSGHAVSSAELVTKRSASNGKSVSVVDEVHQALEGSPVPAQQWPVRDILAQSVVGHRMWREGHVPTRKERIVPLDEVLLKEDRSTHQVWLQFRISRDRLRAADRSLTNLIDESQLAGAFRAVKDPDPEVNAAFHTLEQVSPVPYTDRAADVVMTAVDGVRPFLRTTVTSSHPYRRYYLYLSPPGETRMPQWLSTYATLFWLGSLTRYQPVELFDALDGPLGPFLREFLDTQPNQLLYMLTSDLKRQAVVRAAIV